ncbi:hypothetical protein TrCOL_g11201 [Triparma columacea]|uniref:Uncharacterized protein n=1 Tax=Triparma columacea TaxID=722753 RepID=A0A9W7GLC6_9STRA|nr:hypothetical protein TrCOL_g11201 [Triparma columacea]
MKDMCDGTMRRSRSLSFGSPSSSRTVGVVGLAILTFYSVSGGPFGSEATVAYAGPAYTLLGYTIFPLLWSIPEALVVAELSSTYPESSGFVAWVEEAFGHKLANVEGYLSWISGVTDNSLYPVLFLKYILSDLEKESFDGDGDDINLFSYNIFTRWLMLTTMITLLGFINYRGLTIVSTTAVIVCVLSLMPFFVLICACIPKIDVSNFMVVPEGEWGGLKQIEWSSFLNVLFWNLNYWDSASIFSGDVKDPAKTYPRALSYALLMVTLGYLLPLLVGIGASTADWKDWDDGYFEVVGREVGGRWLGVWIVAGAGISNVGLYCAEMGSDSYQLMGMADRGLLPKALGRRSKYGTPTMGILVGSVGCMIFSLFDFNELIEMVNFLYIFAQFLEFAAFIKLRVSAPNVYRPFKIPLGTRGCVIMLSFPTLFMFVMMTLGSAKTWAVCTTLVLFGVVFFWFMDIARERRWVEFEELVREDELDGRRGGGGGEVGVGEEGDDLLRRGGGNCGGRTIEQQGVV